MAPNWGLAFSFGRTISTNQIAGKAIAISQFLYYLDMVLTEQLK
jgi:hypothetical protein